MKMSYRGQAEGTAAMQVMRALQTPLQDVTFGSGCKLRIQTCKINENLFKCDGILLRLQRIATIPK